MAPIPASFVFKFPSLFKWLHQRDASPISNPSSRLFRRQAQADQNTGGIIPTTYVGQTTDPAPGAVAGIVLGSILGFLLLVWIMMWALSTNAPFDTTEEVIEVQNRRPPSRRHSHRNSRRSDIHVERPSREYSPRRRTQIIEERVVEERFPAMSEVRMSKGPSPSPPPPPPPPVGFREEIIVENPRPERHGRDEEVVVIVDGTDYSSDIPPRRKSKRRSSGYRPVDPDRYAGGDYPRRPVGRRYS